MARFVTLKSSERHLLPNSRLAGKADLSDVVSVTVRVRSKGNMDALEKLVMAECKKRVSDRNLPSRDELNANYGANPKDLDAVEYYAASHNLVIEQRSAAQRAVRLRGQLGDVLRAFPAQVAHYHHNMGTYRGRTGVIEVPEPLSGVITGIFGFDTRPMTRNRPGRRVHIAAGDGPGGANGLSPLDWARRYNFPTNSNGQPLDGRGQTVAIIELGGGYQAAELLIYFQKLGIPAPNVVDVAVSSGANLPGSDATADAEVMMDIEVVGAVAPKANIVVYFAQNTQQGFMDAVMAAVHDMERRPDVISISWGSPEPDKGSQQQEMNDFHSTLVQAAAGNIAVCVATGDHGTPDLNQSEWNGGIHVDYPASDPLSLACGGTQVDDNRGIDVVWNDNTPFDPAKGDNCGWTTGGGFSQWYDVPDYQDSSTLGQPLPGVRLGRGIPDIAMSAQDYFVRIDSGYSNSGGTSAVAPLMSALIALLSQAKGRPVGFLNPIFYANPSICNPVTLGTNAITDTAPGYKAGAGWSACAGLGTPDGAKLLAAI